MLDRGGMVELARQGGIVQSSHANDRNWQRVGRYGAAQRSVFDLLRRMATLTSTLVIWAAVCMLSVPAQQALAETFCSSAGITSSDNIAIRLNGDLDDANVQCDLMVGGFADDDRLQLGVYSLAIQYGTPGRSSFVARRDGFTLQASSLLVTNLSDYSLVSGVLSSGGLVTPDNSIGVGSYEAVGEITIDGVTYLVTMVFTHTATEVTVTSAKIEGGNFGGTPVSTDTTPPSDYYPDIDHSQIDDTNVDAVRFFAEDAEFGASYVYVFSDGL